jgi:hypothetical protein
VRLAGLIFSKLWKKRVRDLCAVSCFQFLLMVVTVIRLTHRLTNVTRQFSAWCRYFSRNIYRNILLLQTLPVTRSRTVCVPVRLSRCRVSATVLPTAQHGTIVVRKVESPNTRSPSAATWEKRATSWKSGDLHFPCPFSFAISIFDCVVP